MITEINEVKADIQSLQRKCEMAERRFYNAQRRSRIQGGLALAALAGVILLSPGTRKALAQDAGNHLQQLVNRVAVLETSMRAANSSIAVVQDQTNTLIDKTKYMTIKDGDVYLTGTNLHILNGLGATNGYPANDLATDKETTKVNGKGNLIVGYNEVYLSNGSNHTGSHNIIVGNFQNYSSFGGVVGGAYNSISAPYANITGGEGNTADHLAASVSGGNNNTASGILASITGGNSNTAKGYASTVTGGSNNLASNLYSIVLGGISNQATGQQSAVTGGYFNTASGTFSTVNGGGSNEASGLSSSVGGGNSNQATNDYSAVSGGYMNIAGGPYSTVSGGGWLSIYGYYYWIAKEKS